MPLAACDVSGVANIDFIPFKGDPVSEPIVKNGESTILYFNSLPV